MAVTTEKKSELISRFGKDARDTGKAEVQIAILTERIRELTGHAKLHPKDYNSKRGLLMLVGQRRRLLDYLKARDIERYRVIIGDLGLRR
jgi:small subunit ribosomal protein S15